MKQTEFRVNVIWLQKKKVTFLMRKIVQNMEVSIMIKETSEICFRKSSS